MMWVHVHVYLSRSFRRSRRPTCGRWSSWLKVTPTPSKTPTFKWDRYVVVNPALMTKNDMSVLSKYRTLCIIGLKTHAYHYEVPGHDASVQNSIRKTIHTSEFFCSVGTNAVPRAQGFGEGRGTPWMMPPVLSSSRLMLLDKYTRK